MSKGRETMRRKTSLIALIGWGSVALWLVACSLNGAATTVPPELEKFAAQAIVDDQLGQAARGYSSPEGAIVAHVVTTNPQNEPLSAIHVWRYD